MGKQVIFGEVSPDRVSVGIMSFDLSRATHIRKEEPPHSPKTKLYKIQFTLENFSSTPVSDSLTDHRRSEVQSIRETEWQILLGKVQKSPEQIATLSFWVACRMQPTGSHWFCDADLEFRLVSQDSSPDALHESNDVAWRSRQTFRGDVSGSFQVAGYGRFENFESISDPANGFSADDSIYVEVIVRDMQCFTVTDNLLTPQIQFPSTEVSDARAEMLNNPFLSDVKFHSNGFVLNAHKIVLSMRCPAMRAIFENDESITSLTVTKLSPGTICSLLSLIYCNRLILNEENILDIYKCAQYFGLPEVQRASLKLITPANVFKWSTVAVLEDADLMFGTCVTVFAADMESLVKRDEWVSVPKRLVKRLTVENELNISEIDLFDAVVRWAEAQPGVHLIEIVGDVMYNIRFTTMEKTAFGRVQEIVRGKKLIDLSDFMTACMYFINNQIPAKFNHIERRRPAH